MCLLTAAGLFGICVIADAQKKKFTIAEATNGMTTTLALQGIKQPAWRPGSNSLFHVAKLDAGEVLIKTSFPSGTTDTLEDLPSFNKNIFGKDSLKGLPVFNWIDQDYAWFNTGNTLYRGALTGNSFRWSKWLSLPKDAANVTVHKSMKVAYTIENNLWMATADGQLVQVTTDADKNIISGQSVHRNEFGIDGGIFFSPKGNYLAYYRMDQTMVRDYPVVDWSKTPATVEMIKYPMAGGTSHEVTLVVFDPKTKRKVTLETGEPRDQYLTSVTWSPDEKYIYVGLLNRDQNHLKLNQYSAQTGEKIKTLFEERSNTYVEPQHPLTFLPGRNDQFIWWSQKDGFTHLYLFNTEGRLVRQLTKGNYEVNEIVGFNEREQEVIITAAKESPLEKHIYAVSWSDASMRRIDRELGVHNALSSEDGRYVFDTYSAAGVPKVSLVRATSGNFSKVLLEAANTLADYDRPEIRNVVLKANDGTPLYGKLILPVGFDSTRKYPVIVYLYNGPHVQLVKNSFPESGNLWYEYMAQRGYVVFTMDGRGSANRGRKFEQATFRKLGTVEMEDQLKGVDYLKSLPFVNPQRMGVHGWSYGGFMTTSLMLRHPGVFKVGVAGGPVIDWSMYEVMYTERYMDTPGTNPEGYKTSSLFSKIGNLKGKLFLIHGTDDDVVVWQHSIKLLKKAVDENVQVDYFVYPGHPHNVRGKDRVHLMQKISDYFDLYLKG